MFLVKGTLESADQPTNQPNHKIDIKMKGRRNLIFKWIGVFKVWSATGIQNIRRIWKWDHLSYFHQKLRLPKILYSNLIHRVKRLCVQYTTTQCVLRKFPLIHLFFVSSLIQKSRSSSLAVPHSIWSTLIKPRIESIVS